jgi:TonB-linked SusC/RagA family outer membrane protein
MSPSLLSKSFKLFSFVCLSLCFVQVYGQSKPVTGKILDEAGKPIPGVSVVLKSTTTGTISNGDGAYTLSVSQDAILVFSAISYESQEVAVNGQSTIDVVMKPSSKLLNEVVVVGYGTQSKKAITGAVLTLTSKELQDIPVAQMTQKLQGKLAGVQILQTTGRLGEGMSVRIRGQASITAGNQPLYVVDGFPITGDINVLNPDEIETISVLKDAASTSLYGSRASNGVVMITTKRAKSGQTTVGVNAYYGIQKIPSQGIPQLMDAREWAQFRKEIYLENNRAVPVEFQNPEQYSEGTNWYKLITRTAPIQSYSVSISAGKDKLSTSAVLSFFNQEGVLINSNYKRFNARINTEYAINDKVRVGLNIAPVFSRTGGRPTDGGPFTSGSLFTSALVSSPLAPAINPDGSLPVTAVSPGTLANPNWYRVAKEADATTKNNRLLSTAYLEYAFLKEFTFKTTLNAELGQVLFSNFVPSTSAATNQAVPRASGDLTVNNNQFTTWLSENMLTYKKSFGNHDLEVLGGFSAQRFRSDISNVTATNFPNDIVRTLSAATTFTPTSDIQEWSLLSYLARINYNYKGKYFLTASVRRDGSSRFGADNKWGNFPSLSAGWIVSDEEFMAGIKAISLLKLRSSYGETGNNNIGNYTYYANVSALNAGSTNNYVFNNTLVAGNAVTTLANSTLGWEKTRQFDVGLDLGVLNNRLTFGYDYYTKTTDGLLFNVPVPTYTGFTNFIANIGKIKFWGHEFTVSSQNTVGEFKWNTDFNISFNRNIVQQLGTANAALGGGTSRNITKVGEPIGMLWGYVFNGIYMTKADYDASPKFQTSNVGTVKMKDVNGDGVITVDDRTIIGNPNPDFIFGITNSFSYKKLDLSIVAAGSVGNDIMNTALEYTDNLDGVFNVNKAAIRRWKSEQDPGDGLYPRTLAGTTGLFRNANSNWVTDGSFLTIKNITLGYNVPFKERKHIRNLRLYASVQQALILTKYQGSNPEVNTGGADPLQQGLDQGAYPVPRTFTFGINLGL